jgi:predicted dehydrogenase
MEQQINVGIIGCGVIAPSHIDSYNALEGVRVTTICDLLPERMHKISSHYSDCEFRHVQRVEELLADPAIDAVSVCTDHASHEEIILQAIASGKHVICEKALTINSDSLKRILDAAESTTRVTSGIFQHRFDPIYRVLKDILAEGAIGKLLTISLQHQCWRPESYYTSDAWRGTQAGEGGSLLINQSIHFLDILQWVTGGVASVAAHVANLGHRGIIETEDTAAVSLRLKIGALGTITATSSSNREWESAFQVVGTEGDIHIKNGKLESCSHRVAEQNDALRDRLTNLNKVMGVEGAKAYYGTSHPAQICDFIQAIRDGRKPFVTMADASAAVELVLAIYQSAKSGTMVSIAPLPC